MKKLGNSERVEMEGREEPRGDEWSGCWGKIERERNRDRMGGVGKAAEGKVRFGDCLRI